MELNYVCNVGTKKFGDIDRIGGTEREKPKAESLRDCRCILISAHLRTRSRLKTASFRSGYSPPFPTDSPSDHNDRLGLLATQIPFNQIRDFKVLD